MAQTAQPPVFQVTVVLVRPTMSAQVPKVLAATSELARPQLDPSSAFVVEPEEWVEELLVEKYLPLFGFCGRPRWPLRGLGRPSSERTRSSGY